MPNNNIPKSYSNNFILTKCDHCKNVTTDVEAFRNIHQQQIGQQPVR